MNQDDLPETQACPSATWVFLIDRLDQDTYALTRPGEVSLVDGFGLKMFLLQVIGDWYELGRGDVGGA